MSVSTDPTQAFLNKRSLEIEHDIEVTRKISFYTSIDYIQEGYLAGIRDSPARLRAEADAAKYERDAATCNMQQIISDLREAAQSCSVGVDVKECQRQMPSEEEIRNAAIAYGLGEVDSCHRVDFTAGVRWLRTRLESNGEGEDNT